jgi:methyl-accepting chemotaxis protein
MIRKQLVEKQTDISSEDYVKKALSGQDGYAKIKSDGANKLVFYTRINTTGWGLFTEIEEKAAYAAITSAVKKAIFYGFVVMVLTLLISVLVTRSYLNMLEQLNKVTKAVAGGDLTTSNINIRTNDELGEVAESVHVMRNNLQDILKGLVDYTARLADTTGIVKEQMQQSSDGAMETASTISDMADNVDKITQRSQQVVNDAVKTTSRAEKGRQEVAQLAESMQTITRDTASVSSVIATLADKSQEISKFIDVITGIAEQTNLLALNAAIESARAGEMGRGFAVVADEVRKLAEQSAKAAKEIRKLVLEMQKATDGAVGAIENSTQSVNNGSTVVEKTGESFIEILATVENLTSQIRDMALATEQISSGINDVSATALEQSATMEEASAAMEELALLTKGLHELANRFKI